MKKLAIILAILLLAASTAMAANTTVRKGNVINITPDGSANWSVLTDGGADNGVNLVSIIYTPSAATDVLVVRDGIGGPIIFPASTDIIGVSYAPLFCKPYIKASECTFGTPANVKILMFLK